MKVISIYGILIKTILPIPFFNIIIVSLLCNNSLLLLFFFYYYIFIYRFRYLSKFNLLFRNSLVFLFSFSLLLLFFLFFCLFDKNFFSKKKNKALISFIPICILFEILFIDTNPFSRIPFA